MELVSADLDLRRIPVFDKLTPEQQYQVLYKSYGKDYKKGNNLFREDTRISGAYLIHKGIVKLFKTGIDGKEQIVRFAQKGDLIGYRSILSEEMACSTAQAVSDVEASMIPESLLKDLIHQNSKFSMALMRTACHELGAANQYILDIAQKTVRERLAEVLLLLKEEFGCDDSGNLNIVLTREELANLIGTATESVIRLLSEFKNESIIALNGKNIKILESSALRKRANIF